MKDDGVTKMLDRNVQWIATGSKKNIAVRVTVRDGELFAEVWDSSRFDPVEELVPFERTLLTLEAKLIDEELASALAGLRVLAIDAREQAKTERDHAFASALAKTIEEFVGRLEWLNTKDDR